MAHFTTYWVGYVGACCAENHSELMRQHRRDLLKKDMADASSKLYNREDAKATGTVRAASAPDPADPGRGGRGRGRRRGRGKASLTEQEAGADGGEGDGDGREGGVERDERCRRRGQRARPR